MDVKDLDNMECTYLGLMQVVKPKSKQKCGIPYAAWHHFAVIDNYVLLYLWDTREIIDAYELDVLKPFEASSVNDNGKELLVTRNTSERAIAIVDLLKKKYGSMLPIIIHGARPTLSTVKQEAQQLLDSIDKDMFVFGEDDASIIFIDKNFVLPENLYMYRRMPTLNDQKIKLSDPNSYIGRGQYLANAAHAYVLKQIQQLNS